MNNKIFETAVTNVEIHLFKKESVSNNMKGLATIVINDSFLVRGLRIMDGINGLFVGYPHDPFYEGDDFRTIAQQITRQLREQIENAVLESYQNAIKSKK